MNNDKWVTDITVLKPPASIYDWLTKPYILSQALKRIYQNVTLSLLDQGYKPAFNDESQILNVLNELPLVRQVLLRDNERLLTGGRVVIPNKTASLVPELNHLGTKLIGESLLYSHPQVRRSPFTFACLEVTDPLIVPFTTMIPFSNKKCWSRRSVFYIKSAPLLVTDIFLSHLKPYIPSSDE